MRLFKQVTIVGLGLIGGSLGMALRRRRLAGTVVGLSRRASTLRRAKARGAIDIGMRDARRAVRDTDLVVLATPVEAIVPEAIRLARFMRSGSVLTDVGSSKAQIVRSLERVLPRDVKFVGAHPLAGSEQQGIDAARADLFDGSRCLLTPTRRTDRRALRLVRRLWTSVAGQAVTIDPARHDELLAAVSHLPHLLAFCLVGATDHAALALAPRSFLDMTRVAKSDPELWDDIFFTNRAALLRTAARFDRCWHSLHACLGRGDRRALLQRLNRAVRRRHALQDR